MSWNHRIIKCSWGFGIHECFYNEGEDLPHSWTVYPVDVSAETKSEVRDTLGYMVQALERPVLEEYKDDDGTDKVREIL